MAYLLKYPDGSAQPLTGRVAITRQDNDITKPDTVQAAFTTSFALPDDVDTHRRLAQPQLGTSLSPTPYKGASACLEASGVEVLPGARLTFDDYTPRTGYTGKLLAGNRGFYDLLLNPDGSDKTLRQLDLSAFDHDWTLGAVAQGAGHSSWQQGYVYDLYDRGLGAPVQPAAGSSKLFEAGYWPSTYARAVLEAIFLGAGVKRKGELPAIFDTALLPAVQAFGYSEVTRAAHELVAGYRPTDLARTFEDEQNNATPYGWTLPYRHVAGTGFDAVDNTNLHQGGAVAFNAATYTYTVTLPGFYDIKAEQQVAIYCNPVLNGEVAAALEIQINGVRVDVDSIRGNGNQDTTLTALAERQLLKVGDTITTRYLFDGFGGGIFGNGPFDESWTLLPIGQLSVQLLSDFPPGGRVHLAEWLPAMTQKEFIKNFIQCYGLTQTTDPYTAAVTFRQTAQVVADPRRTGQDWSALRDGSQPAKRSWKLGDYAQRNWFRWQADDSNTAYAQAVFEQSHAGQPWNDQAAQAAAQAFGAGYLDNGAGDTSLPATKDVLTLPFAASPVGGEGLLLVPYWKPRAGTDYQADLATIQDALDTGIYTAEEAQAARVKALGDDFETQEPGPRFVYQLLATREVLLEDDAGDKQVVPLRLSYFVSRAQPEDLDFTRSLLPRYYPHLAAALLRPLVLRPSVYLSAAEMVAFDQLVPVWLEDEQAWFYVNKIDGWEDAEPSTPVELIRLL
jgi:hypothetical protein